ncbi:MAG: type II toxin-antitoxin system antitoxin SocA domain-containing protein, partial [Bacteroidota bacterium]
MKSKELILYISGRLLDDNTLGATKLNKLLYYIDNISFAELGNQVTNFTYIKQNQGPTPSPAEFLPLRDNMLAAGELGISSVLNFTGYYTQKPVANRFADITLFSPQ